MDVLRYIREISLARPVTLEDIANHFDITQKYADKIVLDLILKGKIKEIKGLFYYPYNAPAEFINEQISRYVGNNLRRLLYTLAKTDES